MRCVEPPYDSSLFADAPVPNYLLIKGEAILYKAIERGSLLLAHVGFIVLLVLFLGHIVLVLFGDPF